MSTAMSALIADHMRAAASRRPGDRIGPFSVGIDSHSDDPMRNFAVPDSGACPTDAEVTTLVAFFRERQRIPRLEYVEDSAPDVERVLLAAGFTVERRTPVMISTADTVLTPREPEGITVREAAGDADLAAAVAVQHHAYQVPVPPGPQDIARLARVAERGGVVSVAVDDATGNVVGTGLVDVTGPADAAGELAAVGVRAEFRRRGIASALSAQLARAARGRGIGVVFLEAEPEEESIYRRTGFTDVTTKIWIRR
jgi:ribosomal protein S18 acetylase RimI-like enzyme